MPAQGDADGAAGVQRLSSGAGGAGGSGGAAPVLEDVEIGGFDDDELSVNGDDDDDLPLPDMGW